MSVAALDRSDVIVHRDPGAYTSHPCVRRLANGDLLVAFNESLPRTPWLHPPSDPRYINLMARSRDAGITWDAPRAVPDFGATGVECPSIMQTRAGDVLLVQWQFAWYPLEAAKRMWEAQGDAARVRLMSRLDRHLWVRPKSARDWDDALVPWSRGDVGLFVSVSADDGRTWDERVKIDTAPFHRGYTPRPPAELPDGALLLAMGSHDARGALYVLRSTDGGRTWSQPLLVGEDSLLSEPAILALEGGKVIIVARHEAGHLWQYDSLDGGRSWSAARTLPIWGYPPDLLQLRDGRLLVIYGIRREPFGIRACVSRDDGATWDYDREIILRDDMKNENLGYPTAAELDNDQMFAAYYGEDEAGVTFVQGTHFRLP
jgi:hypothetical protein